MKSIQQHVEFQLNNVDSLAPHERAFIIALSMQLQACEQHVRDAEFNQLCGRVFTTTLATLNEFRGSVDATLATILAYHVIEAFQLIHFA